MIKDKDDLVDKIVTDIHKDTKILSRLQTLFSHEQIVENYFDVAYLLQKEKITLTERFDELYPQENNIRKLIQDSIYKTNNLTSIISLGNSKYYSKEALFQHKNQKYVDKWLESIMMIEDIIPKEHFEPYLKVVKQLSTLVLRLEDIKVTESRAQGEILDLLNKNININSQIEQQIDSLVENFIKTANTIIITLLAFTIVFITLLAFKVNKNVGLSFDEIKQKVDDGLKEINELNKEIENTQKEVIFTMGAIGESRSKETGNHVKRVAEYSKLLASLYGLSEEESEMLKLASPMHDIGKVGIPDAILNKPASFTPEERAIMEKHAQIGYDMLKHSNKKILKTASIVAYEHHERYDGNGYPNRIKGEDIHIYGRITALADVFDALGSDRCYKQKWEDERIFALFKEERGKQFDPILIDLFFDHLPKFLDIREKFRDI